MTDDFIADTLYATPDEVKLKYENGDLYITGFWGKVKHQFKFNHVHSFRVTQERKTLKMQSEIENYGAGFMLVNDGDIDLYDWLNAQNYGYLDGLKLYKYLLVSCDETLEIVSGFKMEIIS
ncbi:hypothetical protein [Acinetobacter rathckeae]|uniref:hypothetical protein n=1 Tax=Acinetobacter rathckeae TaxID=2605272 RepID=UPI0018A30DEA|nr:hypothetical protein [Acinetobacter rathckeae]MBF7686653.1 hypothetical protein [Acinetobacter rathckeae]MBF7696470.1 hypothetical protein [Acinetobacter rathckeae]